MTFILGTGRNSFDTGCFILLRTVPIKTCPVVCALPGVHPVVYRFFIVYGDLPVFF